MDRPPVARLTEVVRRDLLEHLAAHESGQSYSKDGAHQVRNYARLAIDRGKRVGEFQHYGVDYAHGRNTPGFGMLFAAASTPCVHSIDGDFKRFLLDGTRSFDIDQVNAMPTLMHQDARKYGKPLLQLEAYAANRESWLVQIAHDAGCSQKQAKNLVLSLLFGGKYNTWLETNGLTLSDESDAFDLVT
ncbi:hypothetical protein KFE25_002753 [Diacronema lutheri]|uniref:Uncharacterized protein n=1 Tax=Diacronema lutheri TaxID=2081491 RepID=A0A8J5XBA3_DIALT|nr:hypothetical protein KFE25_002753 [Diacronema lutheri]